MGNFKRCVSKILIFLMFFSFFCSNEITTYATENDAIVIDHSEGSAAEASYVESEGDAADTLEETAGDTGISEDANTSKEADSSENADTSEGKSTLEEAGTSEDENASKEAGTLEEAETPEEAENENDAENAESEDITDETASFSTVDLFENKTLDPILKGKTLASSDLLNMDIVATDGTTYHAQDFTEDYLVIFFANDTATESEMVKRAAELRDNGISMKIIMMGYGEEHSDEGKLTALESDSLTIISINSDYNKEQCAAIGKKANFTDERADALFTYVLGPDRKLIFKNNNEDVEAFTSLFDVDPERLSVNAVGDATMDNTLKSMDIYGTDSHLYRIADFKEEYVALIFGRSTCANTNAMMGVASSYSMNGYSIKTVMMDIEETDDGLKSFANKYGCLASLSYPYNNRMMWNLYRMSNPANAGTIYLPLAIILDKNRKVVYFNSGADTSGLDSLLGSCFGEEEITGPGTPGSSEKKSYDFNIRFGQTEARDILAMVNAFRTGNDAWAWNEDNTKKVSYSGLEPLKYDYGLEKVAMQRAAEIALCYGHERPNGSSPFTAYTVLRAAAENIAAGHSSGAEVFYGWKEDNYKFDGQGHRRNMLGKAYKYVGIAHVVMNGWDYWVQEFSSVPTDLNSTSALNGDKVVSVDIATEKIKSDTLDYTPKSISLKVGESATLPKATEILSLYNSIPEYAKFTVHNPKVSYSGYDTGIIKIDTGSQKLTGIKAGSTTIVLSVNGKNYSVPVTVKAGLAITKQPKDVTAKVGDTVSFSVTATGAKSFQWYYSKDKGKTWDKSGMTGSTTAKLSVPVTEARIGQMYRCTITGSDGKKLTTNAVTIKSGGASITKQPKDVTAKVGETVSFTVTATGAKSYRWYFSKDKGKTWDKSGMTGNKTNKLSVPVTEARIGQMYRCTITGTDGKTITSNAVTIKAKLAITKQPVDVTAKVGTTVSFTVTASGAKSYQWYYSKDKGKTWSKSGMTGSTTNKLSVPVTEARIGQMYRCTITGTDGKNVTSKAVTIKKK